MLPTCCITVAATPTETSQEATDQNAADQSTNLDPQIDQEIPSREDESNPEEEDNSLE